MQSASNVIPTHLLAGKEEQEERKGDIGECYLPTAASEAFKLPTTEKHMSGEMRYES